MVQRGILIGVLVAVCAAGFAVAAEGDERRGHTKCTFVRLAEVQVGEKELVAMVIRQIEGRRQATLYVPRNKKDLLARIGRLREGQKLIVAYVLDGGKRWVTAIEADLPEGERRQEPREDKPGDEGDRERRERVEVERREGERREHAEGERRREGEGERREGERKVEGRDAYLREIIEVLKALRDRLERLEKQVAELREDNAHLRRELRERK